MVFKKKVLCMGMYLHLANPLRGGGGATRFSLIHVEECPDFTVENTKASTQPQ